MGLEGVKPGDKIDINYLPQYLVYSNNYSKPASQNRHKYLYFCLLACFSQYICR